MSYLAVDLDALNVMPDVASAAGITPGAVAHGLLKLWAWCFREEVEVVSEVHLRGFFGVDAGPALEAFGFLSRHDRAWRVRGAQRYLRVKQAQREGGKKGRAKSSSQVGRPQISTSAPQQPPLQGPPQPPPQGPDSPLHRTPNTEHRAPNTEKDPRVAVATPRVTVEEARALVQEGLYGKPTGELFEPQPTKPSPPLKSKPPKAPKPEKAPDPRHTPTVKACTEAFERLRGAPYPFAARDAGAVTSLLAALGSPENVESAWTRALTHKGWPTVATLPQLVQNLAHFVGSTEAGLRGTGPTTATVTVNEGDF